MQEKQLKIALIVSVSLTGLLVAGFVIESFSGPGDDDIGEASRAGGIWMLCDNPDCEAAYEISEEEFAELMRGKGRPGPGMMGQLAFVCRECGQETAYRGMKCPKCGALFIRESIDGDYADRCPDCGYSAMEKTISERKE
jgi:DNA-directed RNA polymerase subunit RPC12/RpoP